jgi:hypothetical protein
MQENRLGGAVMPVDFEQVDGGAIVTTPADAGPGSYLVTLQDEGACQPSQASQLLDLAASAIVAEFDFTDGGEGFQFGVIGTNGAFHADTNVFLTGAGNPGGATAVQYQAGTPSHHFQRLVSAFGSDLGVLRLDLSACAPGQARGDLVELVGSRIHGGAFTLSRTIDPPACAFTHYDLPLDGAWTYADAAGTRPAVAADFAQEIEAVRIPGVFSDASGFTILDNVVLELAR